MGFFDAEISRRERDKGLSRVVCNARDFNRLARGFLRTMRSGRYTGEDIRRLCAEQGIKPHHHNAWGALIRWGIENNVLSETGEYGQMRDVKSHARRTPIYKVRKRK